MIFRSLLEILSVFSSNSSLISNSIKEIVLTDSKSSLLVKSLKLDQNFTN